MDVMEAIKKRCSVRDYQDRLVEKEKLESILEAARLAPSACMVAISGSTLASASMALALLRAAPLA